LYFRGNIRLIHQAGFRAVCRDAADFRSYAHPKINARGESLPA
jgi:hypothetical protein